MDSSRLLSHALLILCRARLTAQALTAGPSPVDIRGMHAALLSLAMTWSVAAAQADTGTPPSYVLAGASVWVDGRFQQKDLVIRDGRVGRPEDPGTDLDRVDLSNRFVLPGLIDAHTHLFEWGFRFPAGIEEPGRSEAAMLHARELLLSGVTSARTHLADLEIIPELASRSQDSCSPTPRIALAGPGLFGNRPELVATQVWGARSVDELRSRLTRVAEAGGHWYAIHHPADLPESLRRSVPRLSEALDLQVMVAFDQVSELPVALELGAATLEYLPPGPLDSSVVAQLTSPGAPAVAAPIGYYHQKAAAMAGPSPLAAVGLPTHLQDPSLRAALAASFDEWYRGDGYNLDRQQRYPELAASFRQFLIAGVSLLLATDAGSPGNYHESAIWTEIRAWQRLGARFDQVMDANARAGTILGLPDVGTLEPGRWADLVILAAPEPARAQVLATAKGGVLYGPGYSAQRFGAGPWCARPDD